LSKKLNDAHPSFEGCAIRLLAITSWRVRWFLIEGLTMKSKIKLGLAATVMAGAIIVSSNRAANADNILLNGGFEDGVYTGTIGGTNLNVPNNWIPNQAFDFQPNFNQVRTAPWVPVHSGTFRVTNRQ